VTVSAARVHSTGLSKMIDGFVALATDVKIPQGLRVAAAVECANQAAVQATIDGRFHPVRSSGSTTWREVPEWLDPYPDRGRRHLFTPTTLPTPSPD